MMYVCGNKKRKTRVSVVLPVFALAMLVSFQVKAEEVIPQDSQMCSSEECSSDELNDLAESYANSIAEDESITDASFASLNLKRKVLKGTRTIACVGVQFKDYKNVSAEACEKLATRVSKFYKRNSRGMFILKPSGVALDATDLKPIASNVAEAERRVKAQVKADYYIVPMLFKKGGNHAGNGIAHLTQMLGWLASHEVGHLLGLGHSGRYHYLANGKIELKQYGDNDSVMGQYGNANLVAPQYFYKGWIPDAEVAVYQSGVQTYELKKITNFTGKALSVVAIPSSVFTASGDGRNAFIAYAHGCNNACAALYLSNGGGSQKVMATSNEMFDDRFTNLRVKVISSDENKVKISVEYIK